MMKLKTTTLLLGTAAGLIIAPVGAANAATYTWIGGSGMHTAENWSPNHAGGPPGGSDLIFGNGGDRNNIAWNIAGSPTMATITFSTGARTYVIAADSGYSINISGAITNNATNTQTFGTTVYLQTPSGGQTLSAASGDLVFNNQINFASKTGPVTFTGDHNITVTNGFSSIPANKTVTKSGNGTLTVGGTSSFLSSDAINVTGGTLLSNGSLGSGIVTVSNATLGGTGAAGATTINSGGTLAPGAAGSIGTLALASASIGGNLAIQIDGNLNTEDLLNVSGALDISTATLDLDIAGTLGQPAYVFATYGSLTGSSFASVLDAPAGYAIDYHYLGNSIALVATAIPTPAALPAGLALLGLVGINARRRRHA